nr:thioredoxin domain-containing protein [Nocardiopsis sinuspersici]
MCRWRVARAPTGFWRYRRSLTVRRVNADENPLTTRDQQVMSLPTLVLFPDGWPVLTVVGTRSRTRLLSEVDAALAD